MNSLNRTDFSSSVNLKDATNRMAMLRFLIRFIQISNLVFLAKSKVVDSKTDAPAKVTSKKSKAEQAKEDKKAKGNPLNPLVHVYVECCEWEESI